VSGRQRDLCRVCDPLQARQLIEECLVKEGVSLAQSTMDSAINEAAQQRASLDMPIDVPVASPQPPVMYSAEPQAYHASIVSPRAAMAAVPSSRTRSPRGLSPRVLSPRQQQQMQQRPWVEADPWDGVVDLGLPQPVAPQPSVPITVPGGPTGVWQFVPYAGQQQQPAQRRSPRGFMQ
jgi:hypothetical protein